MPRRLVSPVMALLLGALIISFSSVFVEVSQVNPIVSAFYRVFFGCIFLSAACWAKGEFTRHSLKACLIAFGAGVAFSLDLFFWHFSIEYVGPGLATVLGNCQVFILALAGWLIYKEKIGLRFSLSLPLAFIGLYMIIGLDNVSLTQQYLAGVGLGLLTAVSYACFLLLLRHVQSQDSQSPMFFYQVLVTSCSSFCLGMAVVVTGQSFVIPSVGSFGALIGVGGLCQALAWAMITYFLPRVDTSRAGLILLLQPALSFVWDVLLFDRKTGGIGWMGVGVVLIAIYLGMTRSKA